MYHEIKTNEDMVGVLFFILFLVAGLAWYYLGRFVILMFMSHFKWNDFVDEWKYEDTAMEQFFYMIFPISLIGMFICYLADKKMRGY